MGDNLLSSRENAVVYLAAHGKGPKEIAEAVGNSVSTVSQMLRDERVQFEIRRLQHRLFGKDQKSVKKRFDDMVEMAQNTIEQIISDDNPNQFIKPQLKFAAAQEILDRSLGKPKQTVEHQGSLIADLFDRLDSPNIKDVIDIPAVQDEEWDKIKVETKEETKALPASNVDDWIDKHL